MSEKDQEMIYDVSHPSYGEFELLLHVQYSIALLSIHSGCIMEVLCWWMSVIYLIMSDIDNKCKHNFTGSTNNDEIHFDLCFLVLLESI